MPVEETVPVIETETFIETAPATADLTGPAAFYRVQIMALRKPVDLGYFAEIKALTLDYKSDKWYRYTLGSTADRQEAEKVLSESIARGYDDAFIRVISIIPRFTIQVMAVPGPVVDLTRFSNLRDISVSKGTDSFCRYTTGEYESREEALADLERVKALGYAEAFVSRIRIQQ